MRIDVITLFPQLVSQIGEYGVVGRACQQGLFGLHLWNPRDDTSDAHRSVDDRPYGGGPGMVMKVEPLYAALQRARNASGSRGHTILLSPQGRLLDQPAVRQLAKRDHLILVAGRYEGVDERFVTLAVDEEYSIGDYVLSGGELAVMVLIDAIARMLPGVLGDADSARQDSFMNGGLDCPHYTRPDTFRGLAIPEVLKSGDHAAIAAWRLQQGLGRTWLRRPELLGGGELDARQRALLDGFLQHKQRS